MSVLILSMKAVSMILTLSLLCACQTPMLTLPGKQLKGIATTTTDFAFADRYKLLKLEVNPGKPYSVILRCTVLDGELYVDAAATRKWAIYLHSDRRVRVMLGSAIYNAVATTVTDPKITARFLKGRTIYRLEPDAMPAAMPAEINEAAPE
ncbi:MAG: hypothetical protein HOF53_01515 [Gammaproteobacteria bacterium]|nr:hypothetical protein [Gammaproteobacteria bacterium]MBT4379321.1 hypothetical protein [Gammaproteobacteria bacterium]MBT6571423.1 hypothetical protein [Gammaproteobacteria bacterium]MBT7722213.1 hypothetical protein [Gammaproteobacteria bacterium]